MPALLLPWAAPCMAGEATEPPGGDKAAASRLIRGEVTAIVDGDTLHLATNEGSFLVDLAGIDAPEKGQPFGAMAAQVLYLKVQERQVSLLVLPGSSPSPVVRVVTPEPEDPAKSNGGGEKAPLSRQCSGVLYHEGCVNTHLVQEGLAWHDAKTCPSKALAQAQQAARKARRGFWQDSDEPIPPWQWRAERGTAGSPESSPGTLVLKVEDLSRLFEAKEPAAVVEAAAQVHQAASEPAEAKAPAPASGGGYWLTTGSGIRHNSRCRHYRKSKGRPCTASEGRPCKQCGG